MYQLLWLLITSLLKVANLWLHMQVLLYSNLSLGSKLWQVLCSCRVVKPLPLRYTLRLQMSFLSWSWTIKVTSSAFVVRKTSNVGWKFGPYFGLNGARWKPEAMCHFQLCCKNVYFPYCNLLSTWSQHCINDNSILMCRLTSGCIVQSSCSQQTL